MFLYKTNNLLAQIPQIVKASVSANKISTKKKSATIWYLHFFLHLGEFSLERSPYKYRRSHQSCRRTQKIDRLTAQSINQSQRRQRQRKQLPTQLYLGTGQRTTRATYFGVKGKAGGRNLFARGRLNFIEIRGSVEGRRVFDDNNCGLNSWRIIWDKSEDIVQIKTISPIPR